MVSSDKPTTASRCVSAEFGKNFTCSSKLRLQGIYPTAVVLAITMQRDEMHSVLFSAHSLKFASGSSEDELQPEVPRALDDDEFRTEPLDTISS